MRTRLPGALTTAAAAVVVAGLVVGAVRPSLGLLLTAVTALLPLVVGAVVVRHDPGSPVGPSVAWSAAAIVAILVLEELLPGVPWGTGLWPFHLSGVLALLLVFPDGLRPGALWRAVPCVFLVGAFGIQAPLWGARQVGGRVTGAQPDAWRIGVGNVSLVLLAVSLLLAVASQVARYRTGGPRTRRQIRWLMLSGAIVVLLLMGGWVLESAGATIAAAYLPFLVAIVTLVPVAVGIAIVRHDLFDIDRLVSGTASWVLTAVASAAVFSLVVYAVSHAVTVRTGLRGAVAAFVTALALLPLQRHIAAWVGRVLDPDRHVALATVERFAADVSAGRRQPEEIEQVLREVQDDPELSIQVSRPGGGWSRLDGTPVPTPAGFAIEAAGEVLARVHLSWDSVRARRRLSDLARAAWVPIEVSRLRLVLREALEEAEASRRRLAEVAAAERRRLERDLHDGAQQRIVATGMRLRLLQQRLPPSEASEVDAAVAELRGTVDELRRIANGIRPSQLDDGLAAALTAVQEATPLRFHLDVGDLPAMEDARVLTAYLVVVEAVANVLKHAHATSIAVTARRQRDRLSVEVVDDGIGGLPDDAPLPALRDRVLSVGGSLNVRSAMGAGTTITAVI